ncbi:hypothetical protein [Arthrobacter sp. HLT1-20]
MHIIGLGDGTMERNKRTLLINCLAGILAAGITLLFMSLGGTRDIFMVVVPLTVLLVCVAASIGRYRALPKNPRTR